MTSYAIREVQIKPYMKYHYTYNRITEIIC